MKHCTVCTKAYATIHILDLRDGSIVEEQHLCAGCAESAGMMVTQKVPPLKLHHAEMLDLIGNIKSGETRRENLVCPACNLTAAEFKVRGRMGCARCYDIFKSALIPLLERVHDATSHRGRFPGQGSTAAEPQTNMLTDLRNRLTAAVRAENYEEAAHLRDQIREHEGAGGGTS